MTPRTERDRRYDASEKGRARRARYRATPGGEANRRLCRMNESVKRWQSQIQRYEEALA